VEVSGQLHAPDASLPGKRSPLATEREAGWAPEPVWTLRRKEKCLARTGICTPPRLSRSQPSHRVDCAAQASKSGINRKCGVI